MKKILRLVLVLLFVWGKAQMIFTGKTTDEEGKSQSGIQVYNMRTGRSVMTDSEGEFKIDARTGDEVRWVSSHFIRISIVLTDAEFKNKYVIKLSPFVYEIPGVQLDKKSMKEKVEAMQKNIGLPPSPKNPREKAPILKDAFGLGVGIAGINLDALYKVISGDARRMRSLYRYEDEEKNLTWIIKSLGEDYFTNNRIPKDKRKEFIHYVMERENLQIFIKDRNSTAIDFVLSRHVPDFLKEICKKKP
ncbi:hypothetical protein [Chryseobacterium sp.]|uniref:hypothetical protein n=1 Tax=Chryseobacterium sp. TaxID=1871047 RepID=UPI0025BECEDB|nr:hypothetical protein [Chryseobacterium sp.]MBV8325180.1 hypothetical protein [Chryseobacterium sp.]